MILNLDHQVSNSPVLNLDAIPSGIELRLNDSIITPSLEIQTFQWPVPAGVQNISIPWEGLGLSILVITSGGIIWIASHAWHIKTSEIGFLNNILSETKDEKKPVEAYVPPAPISQQEPFKAEQEQKRLLAEHEAEQKVAEKAAEEARKAECFKNPDPTVFCVPLEAIEAARTIEDIWSRAIALHAVATAQIKAGNRHDASVTATEALQAARRIESDQSRAITLAKIAAVQAKAGSEPDARRTFADAFKVARSISHDGFRETALYSIAQAQAASGNMREALDTIESIKGDGRDFTLLRIAIDQAEAGNIREALETTRNIRDEYLKVEVLFAIANIQVETGNKREMSITLTEALDLARKLQDISIRACMLVIVSEIQAQMGNERESQENIQGIKRDGISPYCLSRIAIAQAKAGNIREALQTTQVIKDDSSVVPALSAIAVAQAKAGSQHDTNLTIAEALKIASNLKDNRDGALSAIAQAQIEVGNKQGAFETARRIESDILRARALSAMVKVQMKTGNGRDALEMARAIPDGYSRALVLSALLEALSEKPAPQVPALTSTSQAVAQPAVTRETVQIPQQEVKVQTEDQQTIQAPAVPIHKQGDTYTLVSINVDNGTVNNTTERKVVLANAEKVVVESRNLASKSAAVRQLEFTPEWNVVATRNSDGSGLNYSPPLKYYEFPLTPGKTWQQTSIETNTKTDAIREHTLSAVVGDWETVTVPAGTFRGVKVTIQTELLDRATEQKSTGTDTSWYVPEVRRSVRSLTSSISSAGVESKQDIQLIKYEVAK
jgi:tetratricopeptide (TPR) repeat protein